MKSTPVSANSRRLVERDPAARLELGAAGDVLDDRAQLVGRHVVEQEPRRAGVERLATSARVAALDLERQVGAAARARADRRADAARLGAWFSLMRIASKSPKRWFVPPPAATAAFSSARRPGRRLARVEHAGARAVDSRDRQRRRGRDARQPLEEVQRGPLGGQQRAGGARDDEHRAALAPLALLGAAARTSTSGSSSRNTASAASSPKTTPGCLLRDGRARARAARAPSRRS